MDLVVEVSATVTITCPMCGKRIEEKMSLTEHALSTGNVTQMASYAVDQMKRRVHTRAKTRGWTEIACGVCNDRD